jgi:hypothetical protein
MMRIRTCTEGGGVPTRIRGDILKGVQDPFGKAQDRRRAVNRKRGHRCRATEPSSFLPDRTLTPYSTSMTTQPTQSDNTTSIEPTWTDVARAIFRSGRRQMSMKEFVDTFVRLFGNLAERCGSGDVAGPRLLAAIEELKESGFDKASLFALGGGLQEKVRS